MKTIFLVVLFFALLTNFSFGQYVQKEKKAEQKEVIVEETQDSVVSESSTYSSSTSTTVTKVVVPKPKLKKSTSIWKKDNESNETKLRMKDYYPVSQFEAYLGYVSLQSPGLKISGLNFYASGRQNPNAFDDKKKTRRSTWGAYLKGGRYKYENTGKENPGTIEIEQLGGGVTYAQTAKRPFFNVLTLNFGLIFETENGTFGKFQEKQSDILFEHTGWTDLSRNENIFFSKTNFSWYWKKPISARRSALYDGADVESEVWDKEALGMELQQTLLMFYIGKNFGLHVGVSLGYDHYSGNKQDWWTGAGFVELHSKHYKVAQLMLGKQIKGHARTKHDEKDLLRVSVDFYQIYNGLFNY